MASKVNASLRNGSQNMGSDPDGSYRIMKTGRLPGAVLSNVRCIAMA
jgi:hypothetical protein